MNLKCEICGGALDVMENGQGIACVDCGTKYSVARLKEKQVAQNNANTKPAEKIYDITNYQVVNLANVSIQKAKDNFKSVLVGLFGEKAVFPDAVASMDKTNKADFLVRPAGHKSMVFMIVHLNATAPEQERVIRAEKFWQARGVTTFRCTDLDLCMSREFSIQFVKDAVALVDKG